jgi:hypothetical protein
MTDIEETATKRSKPDHAQQHTLPALTLLLYLQVPGTASPAAYDIT